MTYRFLEHVTDAIVEVDADTADMAFAEAGMAVAQTMLDTKTVTPAETRTVRASSHDANHLLYGWLEEIIFLVITEGFAVSGIRATVEKNHINAAVSGEPLDVKKHRFKVEVKAPTFHEMRINDTRTRMRFLLDL